MKVGCERTSSATPIFLQTTALGSIKSNQTRLTLLSIMRYNEQHDKISHEASKMYQTYSGKVHFESTVQKSLIKITITTREVWMF